MINNKQSFEEQYFEKFGFPMIICNSHQNNFYEFINLNNQSQNKLACAQCIIKDRLNPQLLISIYDIFSKNPDNIILNWPPLQDLSIYEQFINHNIQESQNIQRIEQLNQYFDKLKVDMLKIIDDHQKKILLHINNIEENRIRALDIYNEISNKSEIQNEFLKNKNNSQQIQQYLNKSITTYWDKSKLNEQNIKNALDIFTKSQQKFQFEYIENIFKQLLSDLNSIDLLNPILSTQQQLSQEISDQKKDQDEKIIQNFKIHEKNESVQYKTHLNEIDLLESLQIIKSNYGKPDNISFKKIENNYFLIEQQGKGWSQVIIDEELFGKQKYQIQIDIKQNTKKNIIVGILPISQKDKDGSNSKLSLYLCQPGFGIDLIESGKHISELGKDSVSQIRFQICLKEYILRSLCVANNEKNINSLGNWNKIKQDEKWYIYNRDQ